MANLAVSALCSRSCSFCFSRKTLASDPTLPRFMPLAVFDRALDFLQRSRIGQARLLGGEPTMHPQFPELLVRARQRGLRVLVFTSGEMESGALAAIERAEGEAVEVLLNVSPRPGNGDGPSPGQVETMRRLGHRATLSYTIASAAPRLDPLLDLVERFDLAPALRLGLAHPGEGAGDGHLLPRFFAKVGQRLADSAARAEARGIRVGFDCGFVPCMFPDQALDRLGLEAAEVGCQCGPTLDVLPDGSVISCFPLAGLGRLQMADDTDAEQLRKRFIGLLAPYRPLGVVKACSGCELREAATCVGGCLATAMRRLRHDGFPAAPAPVEHAYRVPVQHEGTAEGSPDVRTGDGLPSRFGERDTGGTWVIPYIDQPIDFWLALAGELGEHVRSVYFPLPLEGLGSGRPPQPSEHLAGFLLRTPFPCSVLVNPVVLPRPARVLAPGIVEALRALAGAAPVSDVTVSSAELAWRLREALPGLSITASVLMDVATPLQAEMLRGACDTIVPASRIMRNVPALGALRAAFRGRIRLIVNEACLPGCSYRTQHFHEMAAGVGHPASLCEPLLDEKPWLRLTGAWVLPQHLPLFAGLHDEAKLAGRVTLREPARYLEVLRAYVRGTSMTPDRIGGGPASPLTPLEIEEAFYRFTLSCGQECRRCTLCRDVHEKTRVEAYGRLGGDSLGEAC